MFPRPPVKRQSNKTSNGDWSDYVYAGSRRIVRANNYEDRLTVSGTYSGQLVNGDGLIRWCDLPQTGLPYTVNSGLPCEEGRMRILLNWLLSSIALLVVAYLVPGFVLSGFMSALLAAVVIGVVNATLGLLLKIFTFPITVLTLGLFWFVINALMLEVASVLVPGFEIRGFGAAFVGAIVLALLNVVIRQLLPSNHD